jgi:hypothetical protein
MAWVHQDLRPGDKEPGRLYRLVADAILHIVWTAHADRRLGVPFEACTFTDSVPAIGFIKDAKFCYT